MIVLILVIIALIAIFVYIVVYIAAEISNENIVLSSVKEFMNLLLEKS